MIAIAWPFEGQVLNRRQGEPVEDGLRVTVRGSLRCTAAVQVNGEPAGTVVGGFEVPVTLRPGPNRLVAAADGALGRGEHAVNVWYDPHGRKRYRFSVDDNSFWCRELGRHPGQYPSLFDCFYFRLWRDLHERYGLKVVLNVYWRTEDGFTLADLPATWRGEFEAAADWLKLAWHARANLPNRPYEYAGYAEVAHDHDVVAEQIRRFAGEATLSLPTVVHWAETTAEGTRALLDRGVKNLSGIFHRGNGRQTGCYHLRDERADLAAQAAQWIDASTGLAFSQVDVIANNTPLEAVEPLLDRLAGDPRHGEIMDCFTHEQYFWPFYARDVPDHGARVEAIVRWCTEHGYEPCWFHDGFLGGPEIR
ncbi:MAG: hypothetical protein HYU66_21725 [Armatimonadetes bacterium]|nr:hypothetical protein [Armatimonadota bacterium]